MHKISKLNNKKIPIKMTKRADKSLIGRLLIEFADIKTTSVEYLEKKNKITI